MRAWIAGSLAAVLIAAPVLTAPILAKAGSKFAAILASPDRPAADQLRDVNRKPAELLAFGGIKPGMVVAELAPGGGYYTRLLSLAVGPKGRVYTVSGKPSAAVAEWAKTHPNTTEQSGPMTALAPVPVDVVWTALNYHDYKNAKDGDGDMAASMTKRAFAALKPGGVFVINDHEAGLGAGASVTSTLHRIETALVIKEVTAAGFKLDASSSVLRHPADTHALHEKDVARGMTDQMVLRFKKPKRR